MITIYDIDQLSLSVVNGMQSLDPKVHIWSVQEKAKIQVAVRDAIIHALHGESQNNLAEALKNSFVIRESCGPDGHYVIKFRFKTMDEMQAAHRAFLDAISLPESPRTTHSHNHNPDNCPWCSAGVDCNE